MAFEVSKFKPENAKAIVIVLVVVVVLVFVFYWLSKTFGSLQAVFGGIADKISGAINQSPAEKTALANNQTIIAASGLPTSPWSPQFYKNAPDGAQLFTSAQGDALAAQIWGSVGWLQITTPDPSPVIGAINQCSTQSQVSFLSDRFNTKYGKDMATWVNGCFDQVALGAASDNTSANILTVLQQLNNFINALPQYNS